MSAPSSGARRVRDLLLLGDDLVVATDSVGGIGPKPADTVASDAATVAHFALRVPLLEVLCAGAEPIAVIDDLCVELEPLGAQMIAEICRLAAEAGVAREAITGSTEDNVATVATGIGVTVLGRRRPGRRVGGGSQPGDLVVCAGLPISAPRHEVYIGHPDQVSVAAVTAALASGVVHDALPVGSKGLAWEIPQLAAADGLRIDWRPEHGLSLTDSGGPSSCVLFSCSPDDLDVLRGHLGDAPVTVVAELG
ncbi:alpha-ribazole kinase [Propionicimonas paludicola]|uniref:Alpha-ribazole kinase n=1 Tax=Propionicimonas paludicola TaxID=185243 RepID=A0A2A9CQP1_9ACTN|nr:AIR synthase related protein [Propionicimonas paludicola]PFG15932.1 alpha-ribazole kinase [Propionicimonas paludicola]